MTTVIKRAPERTCVGCRNRDEQNRLLRVVGVASVSGSPGALLLRPDPSRREPGRGVYVHPVFACMQIAEQRKAFARALRVGGNADTALVAQWIETQWIDRINEGSSG